VSIDFFRNERRALNCALAELRAAKLDARDREVRMGEVQSSLCLAKQALIRADKRVEAARKAVSNAQVSLNP